MTQCTICLEEHTDFKLECGHSFHNKCICEWLMCNSNSCPTCRKQIIKNKQPKEIDLPFTNNLFIADDHNVPEYIRDTVLEMSIDEIIRYSDNDEDEDISNWVNVSGVSITDMYYKKKSKNSHSETCSFTLVKTFENNSKSLFSLFINTYEIHYNHKHIIKKIPKQKKPKMKSYYKQM